MTCYAIDTSVARKPRTLLEITTQLGRLKQGPLVIPSLVHAEMCAHLRRKHGAGFSSEVVRTSLEDVAFVDPFDQKAAELGAAALVGWHPDDDAWRLAKRLACAHALGLEAPPASKRRCVATLDWYIAAHVAGRQWMVVTDDGGPEWKYVTTIGSRELLASLKAQPTPR